MQYNPSIPIYLQVEAELIKDMLNGKLPPGEKLPSGRDLAVKYKINPNTASRVYQELEMKGLCFTKRGMGTFVTEDEKIKDGKRKACKGIYERIHYTYEGSFYFKGSDSGIYKGGNRCFSLQC